MVPPSSENVDLVNLWKFSAETHLNFNWFRVDKLCDNLDMIIKENDKIISGLIEDDEKGGVRL